MSNATWVCFDCRQVVRRPTTPRPVVVCPRCRSHCYCLGRQIVVPLKRDVAAWRRLRKRLQALGIDWAVRRDKAEVARQREIERLESLPPHPIRARYIQRLRDGDWPS